MNKSVIDKAIVMTGKEITTPYLMKSINVNLTSFSFTSPVNIIPAKAPIGVKKAPMLLPIIEAYIALIRITPSKEFVKLVNKILIGILLIKLLDINEEYP